MEIPAELKYTKDHEWIRAENGEAVVGITEFAQGELGDIVFVEIETEGETLDKDEVFGTIEAVKRFLICLCLFQVRLPRLIRGSKKHLILSIKILMVKAG
jgi:hypothetical protein